MGLGGKNLAVSSVWPVSKLVTTKSAVVTWIILFVVFSFFRINLYLSGLNPSISVILIGTNPNLWSKNSLWSDDVFLITVRSDAW